MNPKELLTHFNLTDQEADIYLATLAIGRASVNDIAKKIGKSRTATYFHIDHLLKKSLLKETRQGKVVRLVATPPSDVVSRIDRWTTDLKSLVPMLESLQKAETETPIIEITESKQGFYKIYDELSSLPSGSTFRVIEGQEALAGEFQYLSQEQWQTFFKRIVDRKIKTELLLTRSALDLPRKKLSKKNLELLDQRILDGRSIPDSIVPFKKMLILYGKKSAFIFPEMSLVVTIQHAGITEMLTLMFGGLFHQGAKIEGGW